MPVKEIKVNTGNFETIGFQVDEGLTGVGKYRQLLDDLEEWKEAIPRCQWWITNIKKLLAKRGALNSD